jgi:hypothetical protein
VREPGQETLRLRRSREGTFRNQGCFGADDGQSESKFYSCSNFHFISNFESVFDVCAPVLFGCTANRGDYSQYNLFTSPSIGFTALSLSCCMFYDFASVPVRLSGSHVYCSLLFLSYIPSFSHVWLGGPQFSLRGAFLGLDVTCR